MSGANTLSIASEIVGESSLIAEQKREFEQTTWEYLKAVESLRYTPEDRTLKQKVDELRQTRKTQMRMLEEGMYSEIERNLKELNEEKTALASGESQVQSALALLESDKRYFRALMSGSSADRKALDESLEAEIEALSLELENLRVLLPDELEVPEEALSSSSDSGISP
jgi:hypothetical protein